MKRTRHSAEQIVMKLREADAMQAAGRTIAQIVQQIGVTVPLPAALLPGEPALDQTPLGITQITSTLLASFWRHRRPPCRVPHSLTSTALVQPNLRRTLSAAAPYARRTNDPSDRAYRSSRTGSPPYSWTTPPQPTNPHPPPHPRTVPTYDPASRHHLRSANAHRPLWRRLVIGSSG